MSLFIFQSFQGGNERAAEVLYAAEGEGFQGGADYIFFQVKGTVVLAAVDERQVDGEAPVTASIFLEYRRKNRGDQSCSTQVMGA